MKTPQEITFEVTAGRAAVVNPIEETIELDNQLKALSRKLMNGSKTPTETAKFFAAQESEIDEVKKKYHQYVINARMNDQYTSIQRVFEQFDFHLVITKKE